MQTKWCRRRQTSPPVPPAGELHETHVKFSEIWSCEFWDMRAEKQIDKQTRWSQYFTPLYWGNEWQQQRQLSLRCLDRPARRSASGLPCCTQCQRSVWWTFTTLTVTDCDLSWQHLRRSAVPEIWLVHAKIKNDSRDLTTPLSRKVCHPWAST